MKHVDKNPLFGRTPNKITLNADWTPEPFPEFNIWYGIHEVFYDKDGNVNGFTENPIDVTDEDLKDLKNAYELMAEAFKKPILDYKE